MTSAQDLLTQLNELQSQVNQLAGSGAQRQANQSQQPENFTWDQIRKAIDDGEVSEAQGHKIWQEQLRREAAEAARAGVEEHSKREKTDAQFKSEVGKYHEKIPALKDAESPEAKKVVAEAERLQALGVSEDPKVLGLMALSRLYGAAESIASPSKKEKAKETHEEGTSGPDDSGDEGGDDADDESLPPSLSGGRRKYYADLVNKGIYTPEQVREEVAFGEKLKKRKGR